MTLKIIQRNKILGTCLALDRVLSYHVSSHVISASERFATLFARCPAPVMLRLIVATELSCGAKLNLALVTIHFYNI